MKAPRRVSARAYAKLNLHLEVLGRRPDGYHEILSLFQTVDLFDTLALEEAAGSVRLSVVPRGAVEAGGDNLVVRALEALREKFGVRRGARVTLRKRIPVGAGLGGGSSDAAAALVAGARLWRIRPGEAGLRRLALGLGSDVPYFLRGGPAWMGGRGERTLARPRIPAFRAVLAWPGTPISSAEAYRALKMPLTRIPRVSSISAYSLGACSAAEFVLHGRNDFLRAIARRHPELGRLRRVLQEGGARGVRLTGSGSALFGIAPDARTARTLTLRVRGAGFEAWTVRPVERGMLLSGQGSL